MPPCQQSIWQRCDSVHSYKVTETGAACISSAVEKISLCTRATTKFSAFRVGGPATTRTKNSLRGDVQKELLTTKSVFSYQLTRIACSLSSASEHRFERPNQSQVMHAQSNAPPVHRFKTSADIHSPYLGRERHMANFHNS